MDSQAQPENVAATGVASAAGEAATALPWNMEFQAWTVIADSAKAAAAVAAVVVAHQTDVEHQRNFQD